MLTSKSGYSISRADKSTFFVLAVVLAAAPAAYSDDSGTAVVRPQVEPTAPAQSGAEFLRLHSGSLGGDGSGASSYIEMVRTNAERISEALN